MEKRIIKDSDVFDRFETSAINSESTIYYDNLDPNILLKILNYNLRKNIKTGEGLYNYKREETVNILCDFQRDNCAFPKYGLYNQKDKFLGFAMKYYEDCVLLRNLFGTHSLSYQEKMTIIAKIFETLDFFEENNFAILDLHTSNIIVDKNNIPIFVDMDSVILKELHNDIDFRGATMYSQKRAMKIALNFLLEMSVEKFCKKINSKKNRLKHYSNDKQAEIIDYLLSTDYRYYDWHEYLELLSQEFICDAQYVLKRKR